MVTRVLLGLLCLLVISPGVLADLALGPVAADEYARLPLTILNKDGLEAMPDSLHVLVWYEGESSANAASYIASSAAASGLSSMIDTVLVNGRTYWYFVDLIDDIDGGEGNGLYCGDIICWTDDGPTHNRFSFTKVSERLAFTYDSLLSIGDEVAASLDTLQSQDDWVSVTGEATGLDSADVARAVWNSLAVNHNGTGSFGNYLDAEISGIGTGSGVYATTIVTADAATQQVLSGVALAVRNLQQTSLIATGRTGLNGSLTLNLDVGDYVVVATAPGYIFAAADTISIAQSQSDTVWADRFDPGSPANPVLCRAYGYLYTVSGQPDAGARVYASLSGGVGRLGGLLVSPVAVSATADSTGLFYLDLIPSPALDGSPAYEITIDRTDGTIFRKRLTVPDAASWQIDW